MKKLVSLCIIMVTILANLTAKDRTKSPIQVKIFDNTPLLFNPTEYPDGVTQKESLIYLGNGRIALKKINIPKFKKYTEVEINVTLVSNGDAWDKSGSIFVIPKDSKINMLGIADNSAAYPQLDSTKYEQLTGIVQGKDYKPTIELIRFMTPFGVGHFSRNNDSVSTKRRPVFVDGWAENVSWKQDITDLLPLLEGEALIGVFIDTWTKEGYKIDVKLTFTESALSGDKKPKLHVEPLVNTNFYLGQKHPDIFSRKDLEIPFNIPRNAKNVRLKYIATGHGGHSGGDEFRPQKNILKIDGNEVLNFTPWRTDCASFRRFNPTSGVWLQKRPMAYIGENGKRAEKEIEEPLASSDLSRSNWCPGSDVPPVEVDLNNISTGDHTFTISIPESHSINDNKLNHWLVSAYLIWEE
ncbi:MAG: PNGase F N-terminal domain-containing protein [Dysgonamonadaceae bacterium]|nr:PNGase F N-terminal domain-containing protein [Dysgonamonadaceae bacterium]MDD3308542.1 PNGase F N-terminal domain-containing protein [Dysgonamonadaceae bacterium]MDD3899943.1 PNGase F N-terminal domain-containing protein [Dysgonamonadaceae bacterium]MDD4398698.1 PNGase F N-terminal domain-containing protein [Dysgonamonadaceae bacterium]